MSMKLTDLSTLASLPFDQIIDVRAPAEFAEDHIPGAVNLPVLSDAERARVGTIYVREDRFRARKIGAALVARNAADHIDGPLADKTGGWRPLVYCWRGGQRSGSFASILSAIGWRVAVIEGGYKSYRRLVVNALYDTPVALRLVLIDGGTGTAKTQILSLLDAAGAQVIDVEDMATHRGSLFGGTGTPQPSQKMFESRLAGTLANLDPARPVYLEAESNRVGDLHIPPRLWSAMQTAARIRIDAPLASRARHLVQNYGDLLQDPVALSARLGQLVPFHGRDRIEAWRSMAREGAFADLAAELIAEHYDPRYRKSSVEACAPLATLNLEALDPASLAMAVGRIQALTESMPADS